MRRFAVALASVVVVGCGGSSSTTAGTTAGAPTPASQSAAPATGANPCAAGACQLTVHVLPELETQFMRSQVNYKLYAGCPRSFGVSTPDGLRGVQPVASSTTPSISVPASLPGKFATVAIFFGSAPQRYLLVDFTKGTAQTIDFGYQWTGSAYQDDLTKVRTNEAFMTRSCRGG
jgi:hypothetical protein